MSLLRLFCLTLLCGIFSQASAQSAAMPAQLGGVRHLGPGKVGASSATYSLGLTLDAGASFVESAPVTDKAAVKGLIRPEAAHIGQSADIFIVDRIDLGAFKMRVPGGAFVDWNGDMATLVPFRRKVMLTAGVNVDVYTGPLAIGSEHRLFLGYRPVDGILRYMPVAQRITITEQSLPRFPPGAVWNQEISSAPLHANSAGMIATLDALGGFGGAGYRRMQIDFSLHVVHAQPDSPLRTIVSHPAGYYSPDCEALGTAMPVPRNAAIEGHDGLACDNTSEDCHLLVVQGATLFEAYGATAKGASQLQARCLATWQLDSVYPPEGRGDHCTSADAAGFPLAPLLFNADDIAAALAMDPSGNGDLGHAIRFIIRNERIANDKTLGGVDGRLYVRPATHAGGTSGPATSIPYGARLRMRADFPLAGYNAATRVLLNTFKRYGIVLADGGNIALTAESDRFTATKWADLDIDSRIFDLTPGAQDVAVTDFQVLDTGPRIAETYQCRP